MTRINIVPVETLSNEHCLAEYKEITRPFNKVVKRMESGKGLPEIPKEYRLGSGHECYFFDKLEYLYERYNKLAEELIDRGYNIDMDKFTEVDAALKKIVVKYYDHVSTKFVPSPEEMYLNMSRLVKRSNMVRPLYELEVGY